MKTFVTLMLCFGIFQNISGQVVNYEIDPTFNTGDFYRKGNVFNLRILENENIIVNGVFHPSVAAAGWSIIDYNGNLIDNSSSLGYGAIVVEPYLSEYITCGPTISLRNVYSSSDYSFRFEFQKPAYGGFISSAVNDILISEDSLLIVGGIFFTDSTDISPNSLRQLSMINSTGAPIPGFPMVKCEPFDARIITINTLSTGEYIIGGSFSSLNGHLTNNVAKLHIDFTVDTSFISPLGDNGAAFIQYIDSIDRIWMAVPGNGFVQSMPDVHPSMVRLLPNGALDTSFTIPEIYREINGVQLNGYSSVILEDLDSTYIVGGNFISYNGYEKHGLIKINDDGSLILGAFANLGVDEAVWEEYTGDYPGITNIKKLPDGKLLLGGSFSSFGGESRNCLVRLKPDGYVGVDKYEKPKVEMIIFPNPVDGFVTVGYNLLHSNENTVLNIYDNIARKIYSATLGVAYRGEKLIDTRNFTDGIYILEIRQDDIQIEVNKFVITH